MKEYIDRAITLDTIGVNNNRIWNEVYDIPVADVVEVRHGNGLENAKNTGKENYAKIFEVFIDWVSREPTIDLVPVVRCRECKHLNVINDPKLYAHCPKTNTVFLPFDLDTREHFCSLGERKIETVLPKSDAKYESLEVEHEVS